MYYWNFGYTYACGPWGRHIETGEATYVAANYTAAMEQLMEHIKLHFSETVQVCDITVTRGNMVREGILQSVARTV